MGDCFKFCGLLKKTWALQSFNCLPLLKTVLLSTSWTKVLFLIRSNNKNSLCKAYFPLDSTSTQQWTRKAPGLKLYLVFFFIVIFAMFTFWFCPKLRDKYYREHYGYDYDRKNFIQTPAPSISYKWNLLSIWAIIAWIHGFIFPISKNLLSSKSCIKGQ